jgi:N-acetylneuraminic acid mutarotase
LLQAIYSPATNGWSTGTSLPTPLYDGVAAVVENVLYVMGGTTNGTTYTNSMWAYSLKTKMWTRKSAMRTRGFGMGAAVENDLIYVIGGYNGKYLPTVESYNPATNAWTKEAHLMVGESDPSVGLIATTIVAADGFSFQRRPRRQRRLRRDD